MRAVRAAAAVLMLGSAGRAEAQESHTFGIGADNRRRVELTSVFSVVPPSGFAPMVVSVVNETDGDAVFPVRTGSRDSRGASEVSAVLTVSAPARRTSLTQLMVPVYAAAVNAPYRELRITVTGSGSPAFEVPVGGLGALPFVALSGALAGFSTDEICQEAARREGSSSFHFGSRSVRFAARCDARQLPSDWRGYTGLDILAMSLGEWMALEPPQKSAIRNWLSLGGDLELHAESGSWNPAALELGLDSTDANRGARGLGTVTLRKWSGQPLRPEEAVGWMESGGKRVKRMALMEGVPSSQLSEVVGERGSPEMPVGIILLAFGILVGPVNLFYLAGPGRRHRLFVTTPLISVVTTLLLLGWILLRDGTGGRGRRSAVIYVDRVAHEAAVSQEQISRTGLLLGSEFTTAQPAAMGRAQVRELAGAAGRAFPDSWSRGEVHHLLENDRAHFGDWFQSRAEQAHWLEAVVPTRGKVSVRPGGRAWEAVSSFGFPLRAMFWSDAAGQWWKAAGTVVPGTPVALSETGTDEVRSWLAAEVVSGGYRLNRIAAVAADDGFWGRRAWFLAATDAPQAAYVGTLESVKWERHHAILMGPLEAEPTHAAAP